MGGAEAAALGDLERLDPAARAATGSARCSSPRSSAGRPPCARLLALGADPDGDDANPFKVRPLHSAASVGDRDSVRALLEAGANPNVRQQGGYTPLHAAAHNNDAALVGLLLAARRGPLAARPTTGRPPADLAGGDEARALL